MINTQNEVFKLYLFLKIYNFWIHFRRYLKKLYLSLIIRVYTFIIAKNERIVIRFFLYLHLSFLLFYSCFYLVV